jgi:flagellin-like protein
MLRGRRHAWHGRRAVSPIIATILMVGITVAGGVVLWSLRANLPASPVSVTYIAQGDQSEPAWGDPTDCAGGGTGITATCKDLPAVFVIFTGHVPDNIPLSALRMTFVCNGTSLLNGTLKQLEIIPGTGANPGSGSPKLGRCGAWTPSPSGHTASYFNRLAYFQQIDNGSSVLKSGDILVIYTHPPLQFTDYSGYQGDSDDYHGAPPWCFTVPGLCSVQITYTQVPPTLVAVIPLTELQG